jgi:5'-nucleotidase
MLRRTWLACLFALGCGGEPETAPPPRAESPPAPAALDPVPITVIGTNDLHGHLEMLPLLGGYLARLRTMREATGGAVVLLDGGDMFQGTLESNLAEGAPVVEAYEALGYDAATIGNHEFDYGPVGPHATPVDPSEDPRGALRARIAEADFPVLSANLSRASGEPMGIGELASTVIERAGVRIGLVGVTTEDTLGTTLHGNVHDLTLLPLADTIAREAARLRDDGAALVIVLAHAGGACDRTTEPLDLSRCEADQEIFRVARALPAGSIDAIVAGHTHQFVAHFVNGIAIVESGSYGRAFGRIDFTVDRGSGRVLNVQILPAEDLCDERPDEASVASCRRGPYAGHPIEADAHVGSVIAPAMAAAAERRAEALGVVLADRIHHDREEECALGNLFVDLMLAGHPGADAAVMNGGGLRADLPDGMLEYGELYQAMPFDNRYAVARMRGADLSRMIADNAGHDGSFLSLGGLRAEVRCEGSERRVVLRRPDGREVGEDEELTVLTSDFLATGGDGFFAELRRARPDAIAIEDDPPIREAMADVLRRAALPAIRAGRLSPSAVFDRRRPRVSVTGGRPLRCE